MSYLSRCFEPGKDVDRLTEEEFNAYVEKLRADIRMRNFKKHQPWHVIVWNKRANTGESGLAEHQVFREENFPDTDAFLNAVSEAKATLQRRYPDPDFTVVSGAGPEKDSEGFSSFAVWLLRD
jgi:hypothetical protein